MRETRLKELRVKKGLRQLDIAKLFDVTVATISRQESGEICLSREVALRYASLHGVETAELYVEFARHRSPNAVHA